MEHYLGGEVARLGSLIRKGLWADEAKPKTGQQGAAHAVEVQGGVLHRKGEPWRGSAAFLEEEKEEQWRWVWWMKESGRNGDHRDWQGTDHFLGSWWLTDVRVLFLGSVKNNCGFFTSCLICLPMPRHKECQSVTHSVNIGWRQACMVRQMG